VSERSPSGSCHLRLLQGLSDEFDFTVFATTFENPDPSRIRWVRVPALTRPLAATFVSFYLAGALAERRAGASFDLVQSVEDYVPTCDISYVHYCHRAYLRRHWKESRPQPGLRRAARWLDHALRAADEGRVFRRAEWFVVPSPELAGELVAEHDLDPARIRTVANPVDAAGFRPPDAAARARYRLDFGWASDELVVAFVALGHFERKGLPVLLEGLARAVAASIRLVVVGGARHLIDAYRARARELGVEDRVEFAGVQTDVRPFLWAADAFAMASAYEVFALAPLQAAAAGLPLVVNRRHGVAPFFRDGVHGLAIEREASSVAGAFTRLAAMSPADRQAMGLACRDAVTAFDIPHFVDAWRAVYREVLNGRRGG
jgi:glycosyltransferase involved in cell wall biosynthesis